MTNSTRLSLPFLSPGQLQKEFTHNESLASLDLVVAAAVLEVGRNAPPATPTPGDCYVIGSAPTGVWTGQALALAGFTEGGWRFVAAVPGMEVLDRSQGCTASFDGTSWSVGNLRGKTLAIDGTKVVGAQAAAIANHASDATVNAILSALRAHGLIAT
ncbi:MAG TPA: DUF2793 domain-containing protein [Sphingomicrobium sp.]|nr:DUF2793 domain-containing protein [Sphingomicrobium sp.]